MLETELGKVSMRREKRESGVEEILKAIWEDKFGSSKVCLSRLVKPENPSDF